MNIKSNIDFNYLENIIKISSEVFEWITNRSNPGNYRKVINLRYVKNFIHTLDLLETILMHFKLNAYLSKLALNELNNIQKKSIVLEFWQIDIEHYFAANILELCYQLSNAWKELDKYSKIDDLFKLFKIKYHKPDKIILSRHNTSHFKPEAFQNHKISSVYSILRRPYIIKKDKLEKELAKLTMPKVTLMIKKSIEEGSNYLDIFKKATIG